MYDKKTVEAFLKNQLQLFPETVVDTEEEAAESPEEEKASEVSAVRETTGPAMETPDKVDPGKVTKEDLYSILDEFD